MHRRHEDRNIPTELLRTLVVIADSGSFTKAAKALGLTQPAISSHIKRLQQIVAGEIFSRSSGGPRLTPYGEIIVDYARRSMAINDQILSLVNAHPTRSQLRLGIPNGIATPLLGDLIRALSDGHPEEITFLNYNAEHLVRGLDAGYIDVAFVPNPPKLMPNAAAEWSEPFFWVKGPDFNLKPDEPVPLVSWPGGLSDRIAVATFKRAGIRYTQSFISASISSRLAACLAGRGVMAVAERAISDGIVMARDPGLPELPSVPAGIYLRDELELRRVAGVIHILESMVKPRMITDRAVQLAPGLRARVRTK